ncbi:MAG: recombinase family protein, partial [Defluviitaleaceae bacterium]|nr:recombinase family protein [Defluviitaleaceae bacterium]
MYISSVFAQLERDTIAERITDNLAALVKKGNYVGSLTPQGYKKKQLTSSNGKHYNVLEIDNEEVERVKFFFDKYLEWQSINKLEVYCLQNGFKTRGGYNYKGVSIRRILTHPIYAAADKYTHEYFKNLGCQIYDPLEKWNGTKGIAVFRRAAKNENNPAQWLVGVGEHEPIISSAKWIQIQDIIEKRRGLTIRRPIGKWGVLSGVLRCSSCGDYMRPFSRSSKTKHFYYVCSTKEKSRKEICSMKNIRGDILDDEIINKLQGLLKDSGFVSKELKTKQNNADEKIKQNAEQYSKYKAEIAKNENSIKNLVMRLAESENSTITKYISEQITELDERNSFLRQALVSLDISKDSLEVENINAELVGEAIEKIHAPNFKELEFNAKRNIIKTIVEKIVWDGDNVDISFH